MQIPFDLEEEKFVDTWSSYLASIAMSLDRSENGHSTEEGTGRGFGVLWPRMDSTITQLLGLGTRSTHHLL